ncbi:MAG: leucine-rich repeat domain-containing protein [Clostridium sp.]|nr:leucine-rich repeat domain-containing protein [Clostridium sp.]
MGKKLRRCAGALLMAIGIAITQIPVADVEAVDSASASDFQMSGTTLVKYTGTAANVSISNSVEKIEAEAFAGNETIENVTIGNGVKSIGSGAFEGCNALRSVTISDSVEEIGKAAFASCPSLSNVRIGSGLASMGNGVFAGDVSLANVSFSSSNPNFTCDDSAIYNKDGWDTLYALLAGRNGATYTMPSTVKKILPYAFWGNKHLEGVAISGNVGEISAYAFSNCSNLRDVNIPYSVKTINIKAFEDCIRLRNITIPISVTSIHNTAFDGCTKLKIDAPAGSVAKKFADGLVLEDIEVAEYEDTPLDTVNETDAGDESGELQAEKEPVVITDYYNEVTHMNPLESEEDDSVKGKSRIVGNEVFVFMDNASATVNSGNVDVIKLEGIAIGETGDTIASISGNAEGKGSSFPKYEIVDGKIIANQAYYNDDRTAIGIPDGITEIGDFAFARSALMDVVIPEGVEKIGYAAFYHCNDLTNVVIPDSVKEIAPSAFAKTPWLQNWEQSGNGDFLIVGDGILLAYRGSNGVVSIPDGVKTVGAGALASHAGITKVILPESVEVIGEGAFAGCSNLTQIEGGNAVKQIQDRAYQGCPLTDIRIPASVEEIGLRAFDVAASVKEAGNGVVTFEGSMLPAISYGDASGKLYNDAYRGLVFDGVQTAVVPDGVSDYDGTVLDGKLSGFRGTVKTAADGSGQQTDAGQSDNGQTADAGQSDNGQEQADDSAVQQIAAAESDDTSGVTVRISSLSIKSDDAASAVLDGAEGGYLLKIVDSEGAENAIQNAYRKIYGNQLPANLKAYEVSLQETATAIPITGLGRQKIEITIPVPDGVEETNLHVVCLDANGQLEELASRITSIDGISCVTFTTNHFSPYGIYNYVSASSAAVSAPVTGWQAVFTGLLPDNSAGNKDVSPNTGDTSIHPKWFLVIGLCCTGLALIFYRKGGKRKYMTQE